MSSELKSVYMQYYENPQDIKFQHILADFVINYKFNNKTVSELLEVGEMKQFYLTARKDKRKIFSNGSLRGETYGFWPNFDWWQRRIENFLRGENGHRVVLLHDVDSKKYGECNIKTRGTTDFVHFNISAHRHQKVIDKYFSKIDKINILATSKVWVPLSTIKDNIEWLLKYKDKIIRLVNLDYDMFAKKMPFKVRDQMIDWRSGGNFFKCEYGTIHRLPIYSIENGQASNLLNLAIGYSPCDDFWEFGAAKLCRCGKQYDCDNFISHFKNNILPNSIDRTVIDRLKNEYYNLQFCEYDNTVKVFYSIKGDEFSDYNLLMSELSDRYEVVEFIKDRFFFKGRKSFNFWKGTVMSHPFYKKRFYLLFM